MPARNAHRRLIVLRTALAAGVTIDREAGVIRNVAVLTMGVTKPSGDGTAPFNVDAVTLEQVAAAINASAIGVKSRITHPELEGVDDITRRLGYVLNARVDGNCVRADMQFHNPESEHAIQLMDIAAKDPTSCGLSIVDNDGTIEPSPKASTGLVLRVAGINAVDWVGEPAGNPAGMLSAQRRRINLQETGVMNEKQKDYLRQIGLPFDASDEQIAAFIEALSDEQKAQFAALQDAPVVENAAAAAESAGNGGGEGGGEGVAAGEMDDEDEASVTAGAQRKPGKPAVALTAEQVEARIVKARKAERARVNEISLIAQRCGYDQKWIQKHIDGETEIGEVRRIALAGIKREPGNMQSTKVQVGADLNRDTLGQAIQDAIILRANPSRRMVRFDGQHRVMLGANNRPEFRATHERASEFRGHSILEMGRRFLVALGYHAADRMMKPELATLLMSRPRLMAALPGVYLAHSTTDFPFLLADAMGKVLRNEYALAPHTWELWCRRTTAPDFKDIKKIQLSEAADLVLIPEGDEYEYGVLTESREVYALSTYGKGLKYTRQMLINDDLGAFDRSPGMMGRAAARRVEGLAIAVLTANAQMADGVALFATAHANLTTGTLSVTSLAAARTALRRQTALGSSDPLELEGRFLIVPETRRTVAEQLIGSTADPAAGGNSAVMNPFHNRLEVIPSARLDSDSTAQWYLTADPAEIDTVEVATLEGEEVPVIEEEDEFDTDCRKIKVRHNAAAKAVDYRGMVRSSGA